MRFFALRTVPGNPTLNAMARDRVSALAEFGKALGETLSDENTGSMSVYTLDEWDDPNAHWVNPTIPIWKKR